MNWKRGIHHELHARAEDGIQKTGFQGRNSVGESPGAGKLSAAPSCGIRIVTEGHFARILAGADFGVDE